MKVLVVGGSPNAENCFGVASASRVAEALRNRNWDVDEVPGADPRNVISRIQELSSEDLVVPVGFGAGGCEDGIFYSVARLYGVPAAGPNPAAGQLCLNKHLFATFVNGLFSSDSDVSTPTGIYVDKTMPPTEVAARVANLETPLVIKENFGGSSIGLQVCHDHAAAARAACDMAARSSAVLVQESVHPATELSVTILDTAQGQRVLPIVELLRGDGLMTYEAKFGTDARRRHLIPARISDEVVVRVRSIAERIHAALGLRGLSRLDLLVSERKLVILEMNAIPGLLECSIATDAADAGGLEYGEFVELYARAAYLPRIEAPLLVGGEICTEIIAG